MSDIVVANVRTGICMIEDIGVDVPHGVIVTIPADKALHSKDLWRYISQGILFRFHPGAIHKGVAPEAPSAPAPLPDLPTQTPYKSPEVLVQALYDHGELLRQALDSRDVAVHAVLLAQHHTLTEMRQSLLDVQALLKDRPGQVIIRASGEQVAASTAVSGEVPMFIPSTIKPTDIDDAHVNIETDSQEGSGVAGAASALRKIRKSNDR